MRASQLLTKTLREAPRDSEGGSQELLLRAGFIRQLMTGVYSYLPMGNRVMRKISQIAREEIDLAGGQEVTMPVIQPKDLWDMRPATDRPSRSESLGEMLFKLRDRKGRELVLGPTHEEVVTTLVAEFARSYRDLPQLIYQIQTRLRDEPRPRGGLLRVREFLMMDLYSFDVDANGLDISYHKMSDAYRAIFTRCGLRFIAIEADSGAIGGKDSQEFIAVTEAGEDEAMLCVRCHYAANREKAEFVRSTLPQETEQPLAEIYTPNCTAISDLAAFLGISAAQTMKAVCYSASGKLIMALVRGDLDINEVKLTNTLFHSGINAVDLRLATPDELQRAAIVAGYTSPIGKGENMLIVADISLRHGANFVAGANKPNFHLTHVNYPRDFRVDVWDDLASAFDGATCARCGGTLHTIRGSEVGHIFKLGTLYSEMLGATILDEDGIAQPILMGCYGIGIGRIMASIVEQSHDEKGIIWPCSIAPYHVALLGLELDKGETGELAHQLHVDLSAAGVEVLFDDRAESAGVKFNDADLIGLPIRAVISKRSLKNGGVELKLRTQKESCIVALEEAIKVIQEEILRGW